MCVFLSFVSIIISRISVAYLFLQTKHKHIPKSFNFYHGVKYPSFLHHVEERFPCCTRGCTTTSRRAIHVGRPIHKVTTMRCLVTMYLRSLFLCMHATISDYLLTRMFSPQSCSHPYIFDAASSLANSSDTWPVSIYTYYTLLFRIVCPWKRTRVVFNFFLVLDSVTIILLSRFLYIQ